MKLLLLQKEYERIAMKFVPIVGAFYPDVLETFPQLKAIFISRHLKSCMNSWYKMAQGEMVGELIK